MGARPGLRATEATDAIDAAICLVLLNRPSASQLELSSVVAAADLEVAEGLKRLAADGLVQLIDDHPPRYAARVPPDTAAEMLARRTKGRWHAAGAPADSGRAPAGPAGASVSSARVLTGVPRLVPGASTGVRRPPAPRRSLDASPEVLTGRDEIRQAVATLQRDARREVLGVDRPPYVDTPARDPIEREQLANGVTYRVVYDRTALSVPGRLEVITELVELGEQARTTSAVPMKMMIVDRSAAVIPLQVSEHTVELSLLVRHSSLLNALTRVFADLWHTAVSFGAGATPPESAPTTEERRILALLASGATDETIGRLMGVSPRTAHRRVRELTGKLGVETRFQVGVQAVRLGWL